MAWVYKRNKIYYVGWYAFQKNEKSEIIKKSVAVPVSPDKAAAQAFAARKTLNQYQDKNKLLKTNIPIDEFFEQYKIEYSCRKKRHSTLRKDEFIWQTFRKTCPEITLAQNFDDDALDNYIRRRKFSAAGRAIKGATVNREIGMLKNLMRFGYKRRFLASNYYDLVENVAQADSQKKRAYTDEEIQKIIDNTSYPQQEAHILAIWHGLRAAEICFLECADFVWAARDGDEEYIKIRHKPHYNNYCKTAASERDVPIHPFWRDHLYNAWQKAKERGIWFLMTYASRHISPAGLSAYTRKLFLQLGFPAKELTFHCGRRTFGTRVKDGGGSLTLAGKSLGHTNTRTTERAYTDYKPHEHFSVVNHININVKKKEAMPIENEQIKQAV